MKKTIIASVIIMSNLGGQAMAVCPPSGSPQTQKLTAAQIVSLLAPSSSTTPGPSTTFACGAGNTPSGPQQWNEYLVGRLSSGTPPNTITRGSVWDYKKGPGSSDPPSQVGTYIVTGGTGLGSNNILYDYGGGVTFRYYVYGTPTVPVSPPNGTYIFCNTAGAPFYSITVTTGGPTACGFP